FQAVVHYDLAWNPTRHEQREGRVDRFGQVAEEVRAVTIYGRDNRIDGIVLEVLLRKHDAIRKATGVSVPVPDSSNAVMEAVLEGLLLRRGEAAEQLTLEGVATEKRDALHREWDSAAADERRSQTKYAQSSIHPEDVAGELDDVRSALGTGREVEDFTRTALAQLGATISSWPDGFEATTGVLPSGLKDSLPLSARDPLPFRRDLPVARGEAVLARTDPHVEAVARYTLDAALDPLMARRLRAAGRCGVIRTRAVSKRTSLLLLRFRFHMSIPGRHGERPTVAEDARLLAFAGAPDAPAWLGADEVSKLLDASADENVPIDQARPFIERAIGGLPSIASALAGRADELAGQLQESHGRVRVAAGARRRGLRVEAQKPVDVLGVYVYLPATGGGR
ncbi:MAG: helicase, partial [Actinomycetota bacterium]